METGESLGESIEFFHTLFNAIPSMAFVVDSDVRILYWNTAAANVIGDDRKHFYMKRGGEVLHCIHSTDVPEGCGQGPECPKCVVRGSVNESFKGNKVQRQITSMTLRREDDTIDVYLLTTAIPFRFQEKQLSLLILEDINELIRLRSLLPICANCKKIRNDKNYWESVEEYLGAHLDVEFSHGICPECVKVHYPQYYEKMYGHESKKS